MAAVYPSYVLVAEQQGRADPAANMEHESGMAVPVVDVRKGFSYDTAPHIMLRSFTQCDAIKEGMSREEIEAAVAEISESVPLFDRPRLKRGRVRVSGRMTMESLAPHRSITGAEVGVTGQSARSGAFEETLRAHLRTSGVQNAYRDERIEFNRLEPIAGEWLQAEAEYTDTDGSVKRVMKPHGSVGKQDGSVHDPIGSRKGGRAMAGGPTNERGVEATDRRIFAWSEVDGVRWDADGVDAQILSGEHMHLIRAVYPPGTPCEMHDHPHEQFSLLLSGRLLLTVGDETREIGPGDGWCAPGGAPHGGEVLGDESAVFIDVYSPATNWILHVFADARPVPAVG